MLKSWHYFYYSSTAASHVSSHAAAAWSASRTHGTTSTAGGLSSVKQAASELTLNSEFEL
eukprot:m.204257 g.204257  ORF g.204257 m.204257 type:complete len:60 (+) comp17743_c0_seq6:4348-4527(+)